MKGAPLIASWTAGLEDLSKIARVVADHLLNSPGRPFVLWLSGDLGAGKTTFAKELMQALGVAKNIPVLSPTYTYMTEYDSTNGLLAHMDLYRLVDGDVDSVEMLLSGREFRGLIIEWPERARHSSLIEKTAELKFSILSDHREGDLALRRQIDMSQ